MDPAHVRSGGAVLACDIVGDGPLLLALHAGVADRRSWTPVMDALAGRYRCAAYDRRGFGTTTTAPEAYSEVEDLLAVHEWLGGEPAVLVGNSQGGRIAIDFALAYPGRVRALFLVAPAVSGAAEPETYSEATLRIIAAIEAADAAGDLDRINALEAHLWLDGPEAEEGRVRGSARTLFLDMNARVLAAAQRDEGAEAAGQKVSRAAEPPVATGRLGELSQPVHVVLGELDLACITERGKEIAVQVQRGSATTLTGRAHLPQLEDPDAFTAELRRFADTLGT